VKSISDTAAMMITIADVLGADGLLAIHRVKAVAYESVRELAGIRQQLLRMWATH